MLVRVLERTRVDGNEVLVLDHASAVDGAALVARLAELGRKLRYAEAMGFVEALALLMTRVHQARDEQGEPCALGAIGWPALLADLEGRIAALGPGDPLVVDPGTAVPGVFRAPEVAAGAAPSPASDVLAAGMLVRSMVAAVDLPPPIARVIRGAPERGDAKIAAMLAFANAKLFGGMIAGRPSAATLLARFREVWDIVGVVPDLAGLQATLRALLAEVEGSEDGDARDLVIDREATWFEPGDGARVSMQGRGPLRRVLLTLVRARLESPGRSIGVFPLLEAGWPGEDPLPEAGANRVYQSIAVLRRMGLRDSLQRHDGGYRIDPKIRVRLIA